MLLGMHPTLVHKGHHKRLGFIRKIIWLSWFFKVGFLGLAVFARVTYSDEKVQGPNSSSGGFLCVSECATCPLICSPPPPPLRSSYPPPHFPSLSYFTSSPPPPESQAPPPSPSSPPSRSSGAAPSLPPSGTAPPTVISGPHEYSYPYYYFYSSDAAPLVAYGPFFMALSFLHWLIFCL